MQSIPRFAAGGTRNAVHACPSSDARASLPRPRVPRRQARDRRHIAAARSAASPESAGDGARQPAVDLAHAGSPRTQLAREAAATNSDVDAELWEVLTTRGCPGCLCRHGCLQCDIIARVWEACYDLISSSSRSSSSSSSRLIPGADCAASRAGARDLRGRRAGGDSQHSLWCVLPCGRQLVSTCLKHTSLHATHRHPWLQTVSTFHA